MKNAVNGRGGRFLLGIGNGFLVLFLADGIFSLLDAGLRTALGVSPLFAVQKLIAFTTVIVAVPVFALLGLSPRLPKRLFLPLLVFLTWGAAAGMPLPLYLDAWVVSSVLAAAQVLLGAGAHLWVWRRTRGASWLLTEACLVEGRGALANAALFFAGCLLLGLPALAAYGGLCANLTADHLTAGFVRLGTQGVYTEEREYARGDREVVLIGMVHIGGQSFFREVFGSLGGERAAVLREGATDEEGMLSSGFTYRRLASNLGLQTQEDHPLPEGPHQVIAADVDVSRFSATTLELLNAAAEVLGSGTPVEAVEAYNRFLAVASRPEALQAAEGDMIELRNRVLLEHLDAALPAYETLIVPWGAAHMPGIEEGVLERGFELVRSREIQVIGFWNADESRAP